MRFLNKKESKKFLEEKKLDINLNEYALLENNNEIFLITRDIEKLDLSSLKIKRIGLRL